MTSPVDADKIPFPVLLIVVFFCIARGFGNRVIVPSTPLLYVNLEFQPLVNNSTLNILYSYHQNIAPLKRMEYYSGERLDSLFPIKSEYHQSANFTKRNIVVFVLESLSELHLSESPIRAVTPFFDSIRAKSTVCTQALQNGYETNKGIVSVLASLPPFIDQPLYTSDYSAPPFNGIGDILKAEGYNTSFFLGAEYDHFNLAKLCKMTGIDKYYSKETRLILRIKMFPVQCNNSMWYLPFSICLTIQSLSWVLEPVFSEIILVIRFPGFTGPTS